MNALSDLSAALPSDKRPFADSSGGGESGLAAAVIQQVWDDCASPTNSLMLSEFHEAWHFLPDASGAFAQSREAWCDMCGLDGDSVRERALAKIPYHRNLSRVLAFVAALKKREATDRVKKLGQSRSAGMERAEAIKDADLRRMLASKMSMRAIGSFYGVSSSTIYQRSLALKARDE